MLNELILRTQPHNQNQIFCLPSNKIPRSSALKEITSRALEHIRQNSELNTRIKVGTHELRSPDYKLLCDLSLQLKLSTEILLTELTGLEGTKIIDGQFRSLHFSRELLKNCSQLTVSSTSNQLILKELKIFFSKLKRLKLEIISLTKLDCAWNNLNILDLSHVPNLTHLHCPGNSLENLNLSKASNLKHLHCDWNRLTKLDLSPVPDLTHLHCDLNRLTKIDLSKVPNLKFLFCNNNQFSNLDFSKLHCITTIVRHTEESSIVKLPQKILNTQEKLHFYCDKGTKIIRRQDQRIQPV